MTHWMKMSDIAALGRSALATMLAALIFIGGIVVASGLASANVAGDIASRDEVQRMVVEEAIANGAVPVALAMAVARAESDFQPRIKSYAGARGVMQIMPATGRSEFGVSPDELWDPRLNIQIGIAYLERLYRAYGDDWELALSHYNGGSLKKQYGAWKVHGYTRGYVARVMQYWRQYQRSRTVLAMQRDVEGISGERFAVAAGTSTNDRTVEWSYADDYWKLENPSIAMDWRDYLAVADRWLSRAGGEEPATIPAPRKFNSSPDWFSGSNRFSTGSMAKIRPLTPRFN